MPTTKKKTSTKKTQAKKTTSKKKTLKTTQSLKSQSVIEVVKASDPKKGLNRKVLIAALLVLSIALLGYKFLPWFVPAMVNNKPITRLDVYKQMNKVYGQQTLSDLVNETLIKEAIKKSNVKVDEARIQQELDKLDKQFEKVGGLDKLLTQRGLTRDDLKEQIKTQLAIEEILKDKVNPSEEEVKQEYEKNKDTLYKDKSFEEVKESIFNSLKQVKLSQAFMTWFQDIKKDISVKYLSPTPAPTLQQ